MNLFSRLRVGVPLLATNFKKISRTLHPGAVVLVLAFVNLSLTVVVVVVVAVAVVVNTR